MDLKKIAQEIREIISQKQKEFQQKYMNPHNNHNTLNKTEKSKRFNKFGSFL